jgi:hypothetical protein
MQVTAGKAMQPLLGRSAGINLRAGPLIPLMQKKKTGKERFSCVSLLRLPPEGHASLKLGLRANALGAFRIKPAWRYAAACDSFACRTSVRPHASIACP